jgi:hypothetical protein
MKEFLSAEWIRIWLQGRNEKNLRLIRNPLNLVFTIVDVGCCDYIHFKLFEARKNPFLIKLCRKLLKKPEIKQPMLQGWVNAISSH